MKLDNKVAIITGSSKGIGEGIARVFHKEGAKVVISCRTREAGLKMADELGSAQRESFFIQVDLTKEDEIKNLIERTIEYYGRIDILVNNAGYHLSKNIEETSEEEWKYIQGTNLRSTFLCSKYAIPHLRKTKGNIINISSMVGVVGQSNAGAYSATKGGQIAMSKGMALDFAGDGIRVNVICPGWIQTPLVEDWFNQQEEPEAARKYIYKQHPLGRIGTIEEVGTVAAFLASNEASFVTGAVIALDGGVTLGY